MANTTIAVVAATFQHDGNGNPNRPFVVIMSFVPINTHTYTCICINTSTHSLVQTNNKENIKD